MTDTFEDGTTQGWGVGAPYPIPPENVGTGGPAGSGDNFLLLTSSGTGGPGGKMVIFNESQWTGDYIAAGVTGVRLDVNNVGATTLSLSFDSAEAACTQLLGLATAVDVLAPRELRDALHQRAAAVGARYAPHPARVRRGARVSRGTS